MKPCGNRILNLFLASNCVYTGFDVSLQFKIRSLFKAISYTSRTVGRENLPLARDLVQEIGDLNRWGRISAILVYKRLISTPLDWFALKYFYCFKHIHRLYIWSYFKQTYILELVNLFWYAVSRK